MAQLNLLLVLLFVLCGCIGAFLLPQAKRWIALLTCSLGFLYFVIGMKFIVLLLMAVLVYLSANWIYQQRIKVWHSVAILLAPLILSKWTTTTHHFSSGSDFITGSSDWLKWPEILHIIGLSYFTFNALSYLIDIKRRYIVPEKNIGIVLLYLLYFPAIFSGPLHRAKYLFKAFKNIEVSGKSLSHGLRLILWGLFKQMVIANRLHLLLSGENMHALNGPYFLLFGLTFFLYLYTNFSSFIDFFQGVSAIFNIQLKDNFRNRVYLSSSRQDFWKGWHITLNEWFRDYFFFVVIKYDRKRRWTDAILLITFLLIALWHELSYVLLIWGTMNGLWIILEKKVNFSQWKYPKLRKVGGRFYHLGISSLLALIFISPNASFLVSKLTASPTFLNTELQRTIVLNVLVVLASFVVMDFHYIRAGKLRFDRYLDEVPTVRRWMIYIQLAVMILLFGIASGINNYYTQF